jgi:hypothetical protein
MNKVVGNLNDIILDYKLAGESPSRFDFNVSRGGINVYLLRALFDEDPQQREMCISELNNYLKGNLLRGYIEDKILYIDTKESRTYKINIDLIDKDLKEYRNFEISV